MVGSGMVPKTRRMTRLETMFLKWKAVIVRKMTMTNSDTTTCHMGWADDQAPARCQASTIHWVAGALMASPTVGASGGMAYPTPRHFL